MEHDKILRIHEPEPLNNPDVVCSHPAFYFLQMAMACKVCHNYWYMLWFEKDK